MMRAEAVITLTSSSLPQGGAIAKRLGLRHVDASERALDKRRNLKTFIFSEFAVAEATPQYFLILRGNGLSLLLLRGKDLLEINADFHGGTAAYRRLKGGGKNQMIARAVGLTSGGSPAVIDATAGLGRDAFVLASLGCSVILLERIREVHMLLETAVSQARAFALEEDLALSGILNRMAIRNEDSIEYLSGPAMLERPDVVYLDPMFPPRSKSALIKKEMQVFHTIVGSDSDSNRLLDAALNCARSRVMVKRPKSAPSLDQKDPSYSLEGKSNRFDVYLA